MVTHSLSITRERIVGRRPDGTLVDERANVIFSTSRGKPAVAAIGEDEAEFLAWVETLVKEGKVPECAVARPGDHRWWDHEFRWPRSGCASPVRPPPDDATVFIIYPLRRETWSPPALEFLFRYQLERLTGGSLLLSVLRPRLQIAVTLGSGFDDVERGEIADVLWSAYPRHKVMLEPPVPPPPLTAASRRLRWAAPLELTLLGALVAFEIMSRVHPRPPIARFALAVLMIILLTVLERRRKALEKIVASEAPRRGAARP